MHLGGDTFIRGNTTGTSGQEFELRLTGNYAMTSGDFLL